MRSQLEKQLSIMKRQGQIIGWHDSKISAGKEWEREINLHLNNANIILLLISPDFMDSDYCYSIEMKRALERHERREALVIPIILRPVHWEDAPFSKLKVLPKDRKPVTRWRNRDEAFLDVAEGIRNAVKHLSETSSSNKSSPNINKDIQVCGNCKVPISLGMYCWKCGISLRQICNKCGEKNSIEREICHKCGISLIQVCSNCSEKSGFEADSCWRCAMPLKQICIRCGTYNHLSETICSVCGMIQDNEWERDWDWDL